MPGRCSCAGSSCSCSVKVTGVGIVVNGTGTADNPFTLSLAPAVAPITHASGALDLSALTGISAVSITLNGNATSLVLPAAGSILELVIVQGTGGSRTITWPSTIKFPGGTDPVLSTVVGRYDWVRLVYTGGVWVGQLVGTNLS